MKKYQLADQVHGNFGEIFASYEEAEAAREEEVIENIASQMEVVQIKLEENGQEVPEDEELARLARESIRDFIDIVEV